MRGLLYRLWLLPIFAASLIGAAQVAASGWNHYRLQIDPDYEIVRANTLDIIISRIDGGGAINKAEPMVIYALAVTHLQSVICNAYV